MNNPFQQVLAAAEMNPPPWPELLSTHLLVALLKLGSDSYRGPCIHPNPATEVRERLRSAGASKLITESAFFDAMERRFA